MAANVFLEDVATVRLLVIEDSPSDAMLLEAALRDSALHGATIEHASTLTEALQRLGAGTFDAVLLDLGLPDSDGLDTFIKVSGAARSAALVIITGCADDLLAEETLRLGAQDYLAKSESRPGECGRAVDYAIRRTRLLHELARARDEQLDAKDRFLTHVSHELRSPLSVVHQFASLMLDGVSGRLSGDQRESLTVLMRNVLQLRVMIDDLLSVSQSQRGRVAVQCQVVDIAGLMAEAAAAQRPTALQRDISLQIVAGDLPKVIADECRVREVLANLVDNAMKFTQDGGSVTLAAAVAAGGAAVHVSVRDTGRGIAPKDLPHIFDQFFQAQQSDEVSRNGLGLGLYVCRDLIERQGGIIWAESRPGEGSAFSFSLPTTSMHTNTEVAL